MDATIEIWRAAEGHPGYEVSNLGNVRSTDRCVPRGRFQLHLKGKTLRRVLVKSNGYYKVHARRAVLVHRLVAMAFCSGYAIGLEVNHKNGNRLDNRADNLEWVTPSENIKHSYDVLGRVPAALGKYGKDALASKSIVSTNLETGEKRLWDSAVEAAKCGFNSACISMCCNGTRSHHKGYHWQFSE
ncbi:NUMOD4 motif-containing HNH endonuclease [Burkholderia cenocepacia]|uniref:NUMOD4 motif-containing HNH endonuclease n=1 Tax=Burkholderia cenocepacia TaxID=95486 RepID=UPI002018DB9B|nr:NUMOD4 motif-containing HNH endonuclease [Burkholderia cenocepacia]MCO1396383.1 NUMOD4 motif-containing HNH endonuclease [Burkholderia cenocepacia]MCO1408957.1 NUMOD4 motif-containing HNH endonuclease [Burkholderia cenocepacia]UQN92068.1 NUMOD4 motif-containing HNH endonuclease [Burkholderia cenocepacia]UQN99217.1 NUMOD4 motif-containing HNH endonuclease [Burkholderia cenocepacia]UQP50828.1 NUMOD4 motif-containing HNH endonuclease [Burkholderia cenocepacia]